MPMRLTFVGKTGLLSTSPLDDAEYDVQGVEIEIDAPETAETPWRIHGILTHSTGATQSAYPPRRVVAVRHAHRPSRYELAFISEADGLVTGPIQLTLRAGEILWLALNPISSGAQISASAVGVVRSSAPTLLSAPTRPPRPTDAAQMAHLVGLSEGMLDWLLVYGVEDEDLARGVFNGAASGGFWAELTMSSRWFELALWRLEVRTVGMGPSLLHVHPAMNRDFGRPDRPADYLHREEYGSDRWAGTRLAAHASLWMLAQRGETH